MKAEEETSIVEDFMNELGKEYWEIIKIDITMLGSKYFTFICKRGSA